MTSTYQHPIWGKRSSTSQILFAILVLLTMLSTSVCTVSELPATHIRRRSGSPERPVLHGPPSKREESRPLRITNYCGDTIWPGIGSQAGTGPGTGGFPLVSGNSTTLQVGADWQGRVWGRTNCSFNAAGTGAENLNGLNGGGKACVSGDCGGVMSCSLTGETPVTLAEFDLIGGVDNTQTFYDISLVDGYNLPMQIVYLPGNSSALQQIPPNLTNCACIATSGYLDPPSTSGTSGNSSNSSYPIPYEPHQTNPTVSTWCPWDLQVTPPTKPGDGVYPYPDDSIQRPPFDPCLSGCAKTNSPQDCCSGAFNSPDKCAPNLYAKQAKNVCPDAYSFAYDDQTSTFIVPTGGGWEIVFCPAGRSTNILKTFKPQLEALSQSGGKVSKSLRQQCQNLTIIDAGGKKSGAWEIRRGVGMWTASWVALACVAASGDLW